MTVRHEVYPSTEMALAVEREAERLGTSKSGLYKEAIRRMAQDPDSDLDGSQFEGEQ